MSRFKMRRFEMFVIAGLILGLCFIVFSSFERARKNARQGTCISHLKQIGLAVMQYNRDYDEKHPLANRWSQILFPYCKTDHIFHCPSVKQFGYSMNVHLNGLNMSRVDDGDTTPLVFDSSILKKFQSDGGTSWPKATRHPQGNAVLFDDGHVKLHIQKPLFRSFGPIPKPKPQAKKQKKRVN